MKTLALLSVCFNPYSIQGIVHRKELYELGEITIELFQSLLNTRHCSSALRNFYCCLVYDVSILTQYKALFILVRKGDLKWLDKKKFQSLLNTRHCSSKSMSYRNEMNQIAVSILTQYKALFIKTKYEEDDIMSYFVSILTQYKALFINKHFEYFEDMIRMFQSLLNTRHCSSTTEKKQLL